VGRLKFAAVIVVITVILLLLIFYFVGFFNPSSAGLVIETQPQASVFIDGIQVGRTPFEITKSQGEISIKLVPESFDKPLVPFESKINLVSGVKTIVRRNFGETHESSSGSIISFEKIGGQEVSIAIISNPDAAQIMVDGQIRGFTPYKSSSFNEGDHTINLSIPGFKEENIDIKTYEGYKLTAEFKLALDNSAKPELTPMPQPEEEVKPKVKILTTPTGFLRVRSEPSTLAKEVGQVEPGEIFEIIEEDQDSGWYKIEYDEDKEGWISNQYASKVEEENTSPKPTSTFKPTPTP
jgi:hypothetical protein